MHLSGHNIHTKGRDDSPKALLTPDNDICTFGDFSNNIGHKSPATNHHKQPISNIFPHRSLIPVFIYIKKGMNFKHKFVPAIYPPLHHFPSQQSDPLAYDNISLYYYIKCARKMWQGEGLQCTHSLYFISGRPFHQPPEMAFQQAVKLLRYKLWHRAEI